MTERISKEVVEKLMHAPSACKEAVQAGERYFEAVGDPEEGEGRAPVKPSPEKTFDRWNQ